LLVIDVSGQPLRPVFEGQGVQEDGWLLKLGLIDCPETSVSIDLRHLISQKDEGLKYEAWNPKAVGVPLDIWTIIFSSNKNVAFSLLGSFSLSKILFWEVYFRRY
jgi:hypothetical protein